MLSGQQSDNRILFFGKPFSAFNSLTKNRISGFFVSQANRQAVCEIVSCCPLTGKPVSKSGKPDSWFMLLFIFFLSREFSARVLFLSLKTVNHPLPFPINSSSFLNHFYAKINLLNHYACISSSLNTSPS